MSFKRKVFSFLTSLKSTAYQKGWIVLFLIFLLPVGALLSLFLINAYFPSELLRVQAEKLLTKSLDGTVSISKLSFVPLKGLQVDNLYINSAKTGSIKVDRLLINYDLPALLNKRLVVNSIRLEDARIELSLPDPVEGSIEPRGQKTSPVKIPDIPINIYLEELVIRNTDIEVRVDNSKSVALKGINLNIGGAITDNMAEVHGKIAVNSFNTLIDEKVVQLPLGMNFQIHADLLKGDLAVEKFNLSSGSLADATLKASVSGLFDDEKKLDLKLSLKRLDLNELHELLDDLIPREYRDTTLSGIISAEADIQGEFKKLFNAEISARLKGENVSFTMKKPALALKPASFNINLSKADIIENQPGPCSISIGLENFKLIYFDDNFSFTNISGTLFLQALDLPSGNVTGAMGLNVENFSAFVKKQNAHVDQLNMNVSIPSFNVVDSAPDSVRVSVKVPYLSGGYKEHSLSQLSATASGTLSSTGKVVLENFKIIADKVARIHLKGELEPRERDHYHFSADLKLTPDIDGLKKYIPPELIRITEFENSDTSPSVITSTISGILTPDFKPESVNVLSDISLNNIKFSLSSPVISGKAEKVHLRIKSDYSKTSGKLGGRLTVATLLSDIRQGRPGKDVYVRRAELNLSSRAQASFSMERGTFKNISADLNLEGKISALNAKSIPLKADSIFVSTQISGKAQDPHSPKSATIETVADIRRIKLPGIRVGYFHTKINAKTEKESILSSSSQVGVDVKNINYEETGIGANVETISIKLATRQDLNKKRFTISDLQIKGDDFFEFNGEGSYLLPEKLFSVKAFIEKIDLKKITSHLSGDKVNLIKNLKPEGVVTATLKSHGKIPDYSRTKPVDTAIHLDTEISMNNVSGVINGGRFSGADMKQFIRFSPDNNRELFFENRFALNSFLISTERPEYKLTNIYENIKFSVKDFNELRLETLSAGAEGVELSMEGEIDGIGAFLKPGSRATAIKRLYANLKSKVSIKPGHLIKFADKNGKSSAHGEASLILNTLKEESGKVSISSILKAEGLGFKTGDTMLEGVNMSIPFRKEFFMTPSGHGYDSNIRNAGQIRPLPLLGGEENLSIENITTGLMGIQNITATVELKDNELSIQNLAMNLLDGGAGGDLRLYTGKKPGTKFTLNFADININKLLPEKLRVKGETAVSGVVTVKIILYHKEERLDFDTIETSLHITKIGKESLDRILLLLDPEESKPAIIHARSKLKFANPSSVRLVISGGFMSLNIDFQQGIISSINLDRIPVGSIRNLKFAGRMLEPLQNMSTTMKLIASDSYTVDNDGKIVFSGQ